MDERPKLSVVIPCRNERKALPRCLDSLIANDFPHERLEIWVVDGNSDDGTAEIAKEYASRYPFIKLLHNSSKTTPAGLNAGVRRSSGRFVLILGCHSEVSRDFLSRNALALETCAVDCVGGVLETTAPRESALARSIAFAMGHIFGVGNSRFRVGTTEPRLVETVPFGCYRREVFDRIGYFDEQLVRDQDEEFNFRLVASGGKILLDPRIVAKYQARDSLRKLWRMHYQYGLFKPIVAKKVRGIFGWRQLVPPAFVFGLVSGFLSLLLAPGAVWYLAMVTFPYLAMNLAITGFVCLQRRSLRYSPLAIVFPTMHLAYGIGYWGGLLALLTDRFGGREMRGMDLSR